MLRSAPRADGLEIQDDLGRRPFALPCIGAAVLILFAALQLNDPDPVGWSVFYLTSALATLATLRARPLVWPSAVMAGVGLVWALWLVPQALAAPGGFALLGGMKAATPAVELWRETLGLALTAAWSGAVALFAWRRARSA
jgi:hypothetical protein